MIATDQDTRQRILVLLQTAQYEATVAGATDKIPGLEYAIQIVRMA